MGEIAGAEYQVEMKDQMKELASTRSNTKTVQNANVLFERQNSELRLKISSHKLSQKAKSDTEIATKEAKIASLEEKIQQKVQGIVHQQLANKKLEKKIRELTSILNMDREQNARYKEHIEKVSLFTILKFSKFSR